MSEAEYGVTTEGIEEAAALLAKYPEISLDEMNKAMVRTVAQLSSDVKEFTPVDRGTLRSKIGGDVETVGGVMGGVRGIVHSGGVPYASVMELGRQPGSWPPLEPIRAWCQRVLGDASAAFLVARKIYLRGIAPRAMFARAWRKDKDWINDQFVRARKRIVERLADIGIHVDI